MPEEATIGLESKISVTATSQLDFTSNYVLVDLTVISDGLDLNPPSCQLSRAPSCKDVAEEECELSSWNAEGWVQDSESGLQSLRIDSTADVDFSSEEFSPGFHGNVSFSASSSCCIREAKVVAIDQKGNAGFCNINLGGFLCSSNSYCANEGDNYLNIIEDVEKEEECKKHCSQYEGCLFYSWFSEWHNFPMEPTHQFTCILLSRCEKQLPCDVCFSGPCNC